MVWFLSAALFLALPSLLKLSSWEAHRGHLHGLCEGAQTAQFDTGLCRSETKIVLGGVKVKEFTVQATGRGPGRLQALSPFFSSLSLLPSLLILDSAICIISRKVF